MEGNREAASPWLPRSPLWLFSTPTATWVRAAHMCNRAATNPARGFLPVAALLLVVHITVASRVSTHSDRLNPGPSVCWPACPGWSVVEHIRAKFDDKVKMRLVFRTRDDHDISDLDGGARDIEVCHPVPSDHAPTPFPSLALLPLLPASPSAPP